MYQPETQTWKQDETIVKIEKEPFTHGAMRYCYRMKKRSPPPESASNHRFHDGGWTRASNYVAKAYLTPDSDEIDTSDQAKTNVKNDIILQYEATHWSSRFNEHGPPKKIIFIRAYAIEFPDRKGQPWLPVERYIFGSGECVIKKNQGCIHFFTFNKQFLTILTHSNQSNLLCYSIRPIWSWVYKAQHKLRICRRRIAPRNSSGKVYYLYYFINCVLVSFFGLYKYRLFTNTFCFLFYYYYCISLPGQN
jgi:hypothetical protein